MTDEYIQREDMLNAVEKLDIIPSVDGMGIPTGVEDFRVQFLGTVLKVESADVVPVVHGRWIPRKTDYNLYRECSACKVWLLWNMPRNSYCPNCGAKMDGGKNT